MRSHKKITEIACGSLRRSCALWAWKITLCVPQFCYILRSKGMLPSTLKVMDNGCMASSRKNLKYLQKHTLHEMWEDRNEKEKKTSSSKIACGAVTWNWFTIPTFFTSCMLQNEFQLFLSFIEEKNGAWNVDFTVHQSLYLTLIQRIIEREIY